MYIKINPDRIRRHMARSTPDVVQIRFDRISSEYDSNAQAWLHTFAKRMKIKHGDRVRIDVYVDKDMGRFIGEVMVVARAVHTQ